MIESSIPLPQSPHPSTNHCRIYSPGQPIRGEYPSEPAEQFFCSVEFHRQTSVQYDESCELLLTINQLYLMEVISPTGLLAPIKTDHSRHEMDAVVTGSTQAIDVGE